VSGTNDDSVSQTRSSSALLVLASLAGGRIKESSTELRGYRLAGLLHSRLSTLPDVAPVWVPLW
jgi:hypothetical protein